MKKPREVIQPRWGVYALRKKAERMGFIEGPKDADEALRLALKQSDVRPHERFRLSVRREA
jgi:hypothetical protein